MPFGAATVVTNIGRAMLIDRVKTTPSTYSNPPKYAAMGVGATGAARTAAKTDTALSTEVESRVSGAESVITTTTTGDTYQNVATITAASARSVDEFGLFDAAAVGNMFFSATLNVISLNPGDGIQFTAKAQLT